MGKKATKLTEKKKINPRQLAINALATLLLDSDHQEFDGRYTTLVAELKSAVHAKWAPARVKAKVLKPMQDALGSKGMTPETILEALYTSRDAMDILNNLQKSYIKEVKESQVVAEEPATVAVYTAPNRSESTENMQS